ncbi:MULTISPECIES: FKBP-type peptidyl-prolyl cis-trans isomerase [Dyella]|uniref:Peptidyl-prolyl cis-trans isomerase n=2 Tax=Dyella TaxID=231454 RepID=A0A4R0YTN3_9GAMM|nr:MULTISPECIES: FKBP-type peptidyl-prolyl cis-trans isomerase [Dyella]TBR39675.1 FKBP-type peptidyl-prolyl cis-trans isomerase [Dyella terrae]TCI12743.1 FKBP-type peptidyl-prolyl cis-trans isomerase [Dyella soli]
MKQFSRPTLTAAALAVALGLTAGVHAQAAKTAAPAAAGAVDKTKASYVVGWDLASQLPPLVREEVDPAVVGRAVTSALSGQKPTMTEAEAKTVRDAFVANLQTKAKAEYEKVAAKNKSEGDAFIAKNKTAPGVKSTASGLQYQVITQGTGARPGPNDTVQVDYVGSFVNGEVFDDSSKHEGQAGPATIPLGSVIPGFREGLQLMQVGGHYKLFIPSNIAYGAQPQNGFPPNATIVFDVTLKKTGPTPAGGEQGAGKQ